VGGDGAAGVAARDLALDGRVRREGVLQLGGPVSRGDQVDVVHALAAAAQAAGHLDAGARDRRAQVARDLLGDGQGAADRHAVVVGLGRGLARQLRREAGLGRGAEPGDLAHPPVRERGGEVVDARDPERLPQGDRPLGPDALEAGDRREADRHPVAELGQRRDVAGLDQLDDLGLERGADVRQLDGAPRHRHLRHRVGGRDDARRGPPIGQHPVPDGPVELEQIADQAEAVGDLAIGRQAIGHRRSLGRRR
jgi:hypothetical protein